LESVSVSYLSLFAYRFPFNGKAVWLIAGSFRRGSKQEAVAANFPNGLPYVSDASMTGFMEAVYEQQEMPHNITGVPVTISVTDSNGNYRTIGTTTSDASGFFSLD
jgi:hypothetical protein